MVHAELYDIPPAANTQLNEKKTAQRDANTVHAGCSKVLTPPARPLQTQYNTIQIQYKIKTYNAPYVTRVIRRRPQTGLITIHCAAKLSAQ